MLEERDLEKIEVIVQKNINNSIKTAFQDFYESIFAPYVDKNEKEHKELKEEIVKIHEILSDHEMRLEKVEALTTV